MHGAEKVLLFTPYLAYLIVLGYKITHIYRFLEFQPKPIFRKFVQDAMRLRGECKGKGKTVYKLVANSLYGSTFMYTSKYNTTFYTKDPIKMADFTNSPDYMDASNVEGTDYMRCTRKRQTSHMTTPIHLGLAILGWAKLHMITFLFHLKKTIQKMRLIYFDTDAFTFSLPKGTELIKDDRWFDGPGEKTSGKFHLEAQGTHAVILNKKVMTISNRDGGSCWNSKRSITRRPRGLVH